MRHRFTLFLLLLPAVFMHFAASRIGLFEKNTDVGQPKLAGSSRYDAADKSYHMRGAGYNIWFERDEFQFLFREMQGDFKVKADFEFVGQGKDPHRKTGWMVRESTGGDASHISAVLHGDGLTVLQWRVARGEQMRDPEDEIFSKEKHVQTIEITRKGNEYTMRAAAKGAPLQVVGAHRMEHLGGKVLVGPFICSHNPEVMEEACIYNVVITPGK